MTPHLIVCGVFRGALEHLEICDLYPGMKVTYLPPYLHHQPVELRGRLEEAIGLAREQGHTVICLYGKCFPEMDEFLNEREILRPAGGHCYEMLLGEKTYRRIIEQEVGTYFIEKELVIHFDNYCKKPLELDDPQMRNWFFEPYKRLSYIRQPQDPDLEAQISKIARFLELDLVVEDADYKELENNIDKIMKTI
jgi:hypothetical protein